MKPHKNAIVVEPSARNRGDISPDCGQSVSTVITRMVDLAELLAWFESRRHEPSAEDVRTRWGCSRATAYRWLGLWHTSVVERALYAKSGALTPAKSRRIELSRADSAEKRRNARLNP
jgi:hypothetical protein